MIGRTLDHYRIEEKLGEGGMGVVYRAWDTHLERAVAIKVLRAEAVADPERKRRFVQEARAASALNHPNIVTIYDIDAAGGVDFIAMEHVAGQTLAAAIGRQGLALAKALKYAAQIADALARAHAAGIVHRDLKPANLMVTDEGVVKVLDFGLAKLTEIGAGESEATIDAVAAGHTLEGAIVGTVAYMSPEQAEGKKLDARSDIFSFGSVLYEMLTGRRAFHGETQISTMSAILSQEPKALGAAAPPGIERIIARCLRKDPGQRFHHLMDVKLALEDAAEEKPAAEAARGSWRWAAAALLVLAVAGAAWWLSRGRAAGPAAGLVLTRLTWDSGLTTEPALAPDGKLVAYASDRGGDGNLDIWVQQVAGGEAIRLTRHEADDREPAFSPDGQRIAFRSDRDGGGVYVVSTLGGEARLLAKDGRRPRFSPDGAKIAYWTGAIGGASGGRVYVVEASGGAPRRVAEELNVAESPVWSPDGRKLLLVGSAPGQAYDWWVAPEAGGAAVQTGVAAEINRLGLILDLRSAGGWLAEGQVVFGARLGDSTNLWQIPVSPASGKVAGAPQRLTTGPGPEAHPSAAGGALVFASLSENVNVWRLPADADQGKPRGEIERLTRATAADVRPSISADGKKLAFLSNRSGNRDVWLKDLESGRETALTATPANEQWPVISPDGSRVAYSVVQNQVPTAFVVGTARPGVAEKICAGCERLEHWSPDGTRLLYYYDEDGSPVRQALLRVGSGERAVLIEHPKNGLHTPRFSPDGRWVSFHEVTGPLTRRIYVAPFRDGAKIPPGEWIPVTDGTALDRDACWSPDGNLLYFHSERDSFRCIWAQRLEAATKRPAGAMFPVQHFHHAQRSLMSVENPSMVGVSAAPGKLIFSMGEHSGNIWMAKGRE